MGNFRVIKILDLLISFLILSTVFLLPIYFALFLKTNNVFELQKIVLFKILVLFLFFLSFLKISFSRTEAAYFADVFRYILSKKIIFLPILFLVFSLFLSLFFSYNFENSFYGSYERQFGIEAYLYYFLFFILILFNIRNKAQIRQVFLAIVYSSIFVSAYALVQASGNDPLSWSESSRLRAVSTFGQPNILGAYLLLALPFCFYFFYSAKNNLLKLFFFASLLLDLAALFFSYSLSAWLSFFFGLTMFLFVFFKNEDFVSKDFFSKKKLLFVFLAIFIVFSSIAGIHNKNILLGKLNSLFHPESGSFAARLDFWQASWTAIKKRPIFGYGLENQSEILAKSYEKKWGVHSNVNVIPEKAHNIFLDALLAGGPFGLLSYLFLLFLFYYLIFKNIAQNRSKKLNYSIFFALTAYLASLFLNFSFMVGELYFWLFLALLIIISRDESEPEKEEPLQKQSIFKKIILIFSSLFLLFLILFQVNQQVKIVIADHYLLEIMKARRDNQFFKALTLYDYIKDLNIRDIEHDRRFALVTISWFPSLDRDGSMYRKVGEEVLHKILPLIDGETREDYFARAKIYGFLAGQEKPDYYGKAIENFSYLLKNYPGLPLNYYQIAELYYKKGDYDLAIDYYSRFLQKLPDLDNPYLNKDHENVIKKEMFFAYVGLGDVYLAKNDFEKSKSYYLQAFEINSKTAVIYEKLSNYSKMKGDWEVAIDYNKKAAEIWPYDYAWPFETAKIYKEMGDAEKAKEYVEIAANLNPQNMMIRDFLNNLK